jgi:hypothetical protein
MLITILQNSSLPIIGLITVCIAWRQWRTAELKRRHDLLERRLKVYDTMMDFFENFETFFASLDAVLVSQVAVGFHAQRAAVLMSKPAGNGRNVHAGFNAAGGKQWRRSWWVMRFTPASFAARSIDFWHSKTCITGFSGNSPGCSPRIFSSNCRRLLFSGIHRALLFLVTRT